MFGAFLGNMLANALRRESIRSRVHLHSDCGAVVGMFSDLVDYSWRSDATYAGVARDVLRDGNGISGVSHVRAHLNLDDGSQDLRFWQRLMELWITLPNARQQPIMGPMP